MHWLSEFYRIMLLRIVPDWFLNEATEAYI